MTGLHYFYQLALSAALFCIPPAGGYVYQMIYDCEYGDNIQDMVYLVKNVFNQKLNNMYDSRIGKYVGFGEYGMKNADHYNNQSWKLAIRKVEVETECRYKARFFQKSTLDRKVPPAVKVHQTKPVAYGERTILECNVLGFYPQEVRVGWLRDGEEVTTNVMTSDILANGDWSYQFHSYLELTLKKGERVSCWVSHSRLMDILVVDWDSSSLDAKILKKTVGSIFLFIGLTAAAGGALYFWWKKRFDFKPLGRKEQTCVGYGEPSTSPESLSESLSVVSGCTKHF